MTVDGLYATAGMRDQFPNATDAADTTLSTEPTCKPTGT